MKWVKRLAKGLGALLLLLLLTGFGYEQVGRWRAARDFPPPGTLHAVDGRMMHLYCLGEGTPTVILEHGMGWGSPSWSGIHTELATSSRVCAYDRAGYMWSQSRRSTGDAVGITRELHELLTAANVPPPYIMVGHSMGGPLSRVFDDRYPGEVAGFVFVDASHPDQEQRLPPAFRTSPPSTTELLAVRTLSRVGATRFFLTGSPQFREVVAPLPASSQEAMMAFAPTMAGYVREWAALDAIHEQARATRSLGDRPVVVLTAAKPTSPDRLPPAWNGEDRFRAVWRELQTELAALSSNSDHRILPNAGHFVHIDEPAAVMQAVRDVIEAVRTSGPVRKADR